MPGRLPTCRKSAAPPHNHLSQGSKQIAHPHRLPHHYPAAVAGQRNGGLHTFAGSILTSDTWACVVPVKPWATRPSRMRSTAALVCAATSTLLRAGLPGAGNRRNRISATSSVVLPVSKVN